MFYDQFVELCKERGISPSAVTREIGLNNSSSTAWKRGSIPKGETLQKLADFFHVSVDYLLGNVSEPFFYLDNARIIREINSYSDDELIPENRINVAVAQMDEDGKRKVADYAEDILPRYRAQSAPTAHAEPPEGKEDTEDTTPPPEGAEGPQDGK